jgi:hypothetical protein
MRGDTTAHNLSERNRRSGKSVFTMRGKLETMKSDRLLTAIFALAAVWAVAATGCPVRPTAGSPTPGPAQTGTLTAYSPAMGPSPTTAPAVSSVVVPTVTIPSLDAQPTAVPTSADLDMAAGSERAVELAREDLAERLGLPLESTQVISVTTAQWPDASLGCAQPGEVYAQVITPGFLVWLVAQEQMYEYHTDAGQLAVLCQEEPMPSQHTTPGQVEPGLEGLANQAMQDLARRLSIPIEQIEVLEAKSVVWPDGGLGCPEPGMAYAQVQVEGVLIRLHAGQRTYSYHGGGGTPPFLCERPAG